MIHFGLMVGGRKVAKQDARGLNIGDVTDLF